MKRKLGKDKKNKTPTITPDQLLKSGDKTTAIEAALLKMLLALLAAILAL